MELLQTKCSKFIAVSHQKTEQNSVSWAYDNGKFPADFGPKSCPNLLSFLNARNGHREFLDFGVVQKPKRQQIIEIKTIASTYDRRVR